jgi:chemotaxis protein methyltransferase CheR
MEAIYLKYSYDFRNYTVASQKRRVLHALDQLGLPSISALQERVLRDPALFGRLLQFLTIPVSEMFRDPAYFLALRQHVVPILHTYPSVKVWVAGCSTGEEVFSLAILLREEGLLARTQIYATDINPASLEKARQGIFPLEAIRGYTTNYQRAGGRSRIFRLLHRRLRRRALRPLAVRRRDLCRPQPGHRQRVRGNAAGVVPQRAHLLQPAAAGPGARAVPRVAVAPRLSGPGLEGKHRLLGLRDRFDTHARAERIYRKLA